MDVEIKSLVEEFENHYKDDPDFSKKCSKLSKGINEGSSTFLQLIEHLKSLLIDTVPSNREFGMHILTTVLEEISPDHISPTQLNFVCDFYGEKLKDHHQLIPATLRGILALSNFNVSEGQPAKLLHPLFENISCQQQQQHDRLNIYKIFQKWLENRPNELREMGFDFVYGVISAMDGERDPRNLLFLFNWVPTFLKQFTLGHLSEEMFEVLACYFPVDFRTPPQDPNSISRRTLASSLANCLCGTPEFAEYCLPLALEKLSSSLVIAKFDSLDILAKGCDCYPLSFYIQHSTDIWSQIQREVLNGGDQELEKVALDTFVTIMKKLSQSPDDVYKPILSDIVDTLKGNLLPNLKLFVPSCKMLHYLCKSSRIAAAYVVAEIVPLMTNTFHITMTPTHQVLILNNLVYFVCVYTDVYQNYEITENPHLSLVPCICLKATSSNDHELRSAGLHCISLITKSVPNNIRQCCYEHMRSLLINEQPQHVRYSLLEAFKSFADMYPDEINIHILDQIQIKNDKELYWYLQSLSTIVDMQKFTHNILGTFLKYCQSDFETALTGIDCLRQLLERYCNHTGILFHLWDTQLVVRLLDFVVNYINDINVCNSNHKQLLYNVATVSKLIVGCQGSQTQIGLAPKCDEIVSLYRSCRNVGLIIIIDGLISRLHRGIELQSDIVPDLLCVALECEHDWITTIANGLLANILNKNENGEKLENDLRWLEDCLHKELDTGKLQKAIYVLSYVTKALLMKNHIKSGDWTEKLVRLLDDHEEAAKGFEIIMKEKCPSLNEECYCNIKFLYRQKFFMEMTTLLSQNYKDSNRNYLSAVGYLLKEVPQQVFVMQFKKIIKLVLISLEKCEDGEILSVILGTLCDLVRNKESVTEEYLQELLSRFLVLANFKGSMNVRIKALEGIQHFAVGYPMYKLLPLKSGVIQNLALCLDDKKRLVRKAAVEARLSWIMLDALI